MKQYDLSFSINLRDEDGDSYEDCILLHLGNGIIIQFEDLDSYDRFVEGMQGMRDEIEENLV